MIDEFQEKEYFLNQISSTSRFVFWEKSTGSI